MSGFIYWKKKKGAGSIFHLKVSHQVTQVTVVYIIADHEFIALSKKYLIFSKFL